MSILYMMCGHVGSGKSTLARALKEKNPEAVLIQSDVVRHSMVAMPVYTAEENSKLFPIIHKMIDAGLREGKDVIYEATNRRKYERKAPNEIANRYGAKICVIHINTPEEVLIERLTNRPKDINLSDAGVDVYLRHREKPFDEPSHSYVKVNGTDTVEHNLLQVNLFVTTVLEGDGFMELGSAYSEEP